MERTVAQIGTGTPTTIAEAGHEIARLEKLINIPAYRGIVLSKKQQQFSTMATSRVSFLYGFIRGMEKLRQQIVDRLNGEEYN